MLLIGWVNLVEELLGLFPPDIPCLRWTGALNKDGYARHRVPIVFAGLRFIERSI
jgi:hypothetical protein